MKKLFLFFAALLPLCGVSAQEKTETGIVFFEGTYAEALKAAKEAGRTLFVDCYTQWCGPCKQMAKNTFTDAAVAEFFNGSFVNLKLDMETPDGIAQKDKLGVNAYPTLVFVDPNTDEVIHKIVGSCNAQEFLKRTVAGLTGNNVKTMTERYNAGERSDEFIADYIEVLADANEKERLPEIVQPYLEGKTEQMLTDRKIFNYFSSYVESPYSKPFVFFLENKDKFVEQYGNQPVDMKYRYTWVLYGRKYTKAEADGTYTFDEAGFAEYMKYMKANKVKIAKEVEILSRMYYAECAQNWKEYISYGDKLIRKYDASTLEVYNWAIRINKLCADQKLRNHAAIWCDEYASKLEIEEQQRAAQNKGGMAMAMRMGPQGNHFKQVGAQLRAAHNAPTGF